MFNSYVRETVNQAIQLAFGRTDFTPHASMLSTSDNTHMKMSNVPTRANYTPMLACNYFAR